MTSAMRPASSDSRGFGCRSSEGRRASPGGRGFAIAALLLAWLAGGCRDPEAPLRSRADGISLFDDLYAVSVIDAERAIAVGDHGSIYRSEDAGAHWYAADPTTERSLYAVSMADAEAGWAVGQYGTILRTTDGGRTWALQSGLAGREGLHLFGVHAVDADSAWAVGVWGSRILTRDGGATWTDHSVPVTLDHPVFPWLSKEDQATIRAGGIVQEDVVLNDVYCRPRPSERCWIVGEFGTVFRSEDLGATWLRGVVEHTGKAGRDRPWQAGDALHLFAVHFAGEREGWVAGLGGAVLRSADGGRRWHRAETGVRHSFFSIARSADRVVAVGEKGLVRFSSDGGETWAEPADGDQPAAFSFLRDLDFDAAGKVGYMVGRGGLILRTDDAGRRWRAVLPPERAGRAFLPTAVVLLKRATPAADSNGSRRVK